MAKRCSLVMGEAPLVLVMTQTSELAGNGQPCRQSIHVGLGEICG